MPSMAANARSRVELIQTAGSLLPVPHTSLSVTNASTPSNESGAHLKKLLSLSNESF